MYKMDDGLGSEAVRGVACVDWDGAWWCVCCLVVVVVMVYVWGGV